MESVTKLDEYYTDVPVHRKKHLTDILYLRLFLVCKLNLYDLGESVNQHSYVLAKHLGKDFEISLLRAILHSIVKERSADGICIETKLCNDLSNRYRMAYVRLSTKSKLTCVEFLSI